MRLALVAMPWNRLDSPSPALGLLTSVVRRERPYDEVTCKFPYLEVGERIGPELYAAIATQYATGDMLYACSLYPERVAATRRLFVDEIVKDRPALEAIGLSTSSRSCEALFDHVYSVTLRHVEDFAAELAGQHDVVGFTTTYCQLFASLAVAKQLVKLDPSVRIVFGGSGVAYASGPSITSEFPYVHDVIQGTGEEALLELLATVESAKPDAPARPSDPREAANQVPFSDLPLPDFDAYPELAKRYGYTDWVIPVEGSRGCWWDRVKRTGNPLNSCRFCTQNGGTYQEKTAETLVREMIALAERYGNLNFQFTDLVARTNGLEEFATALRNSGRKFAFWWSLRANVHPYEHLLIWEAGCNEIQIGIEGLSTAYLKRINKGTKAIHNLQAMKTCFELGMDNQSNLVTGFPGATQEEVDETERIVLDYGILYQPLRNSPFGLEHNTSVAKKPEAFGVENIRNSRMFRAALPEDVWERLRLYALDFDVRGEVADWSRVVAALETWRALHERVRKENFDRGEFFSWAPLYYVDRGIRLDLVDRRQGRDITRLEGVWRELYLFCMEYQSVRTVIRQFAAVQGEQETVEMIQALAAAKLMYVEGESCLSLAVATFPHVAQERIRRHYQAWREATRKRPQALGVVR